MNDTATYSTGIRVRVGSVVHEGAVVPEGRGARPEATAAWKSVSLRAVAKYALASSCTSAPAPKRASSVEITLARSAAASAG